MGTGADTPVSNGEDAMKRVIVETAAGPVELYEAKMADGTIMTVDMMCVMVASDHGWLHEDELDAEGYPKWPEPEEKR